MSRTFSAPRPHVTGRGRVGSRRWVVAVAACAVLCSVSTTPATALPAPPPPAASATTQDASIFGGHEFVTRPDLRPAEVTSLTPPENTTPGYLFHTPGAITTMDPAGPAPEAPVQPGAMISDEAGEPVWFAPAKPGAQLMDLQVQEYQGKPVLTWWQGTAVVPPGYGEGERVIADTSYQPIATVHTGNDVNADLHDMVITPQNTAITLAYDEVVRDLTPIGGPKDAKVLEGIVQEIDIASGDVLLDWRSLRDVPEGDSMLAPPTDPNDPWDYIHLNAVGLDGDGNILISGRNTHAAYQINRETGDLNWRLGGKQSDFEMGEGAAFEYQHDVRRQPDGTISVFDNSNDHVEGAISRALTLKVDEEAHTAEVVHEQGNPEKIASPNQGCFRPQADGNALVGWGSLGFFSEFAPDGKMLNHARFDEGVASYRTLKAPWVGTPKEAPVAAGRPGPDGKGTTVFASWNGSTEVRGWRVLTGPDAENLHPVTDVPRSGFETPVDIPDEEKFVAMHALDAEGNFLASSAPVEVQR